MNLKKNKTMQGGLGNHLISEAIHGAVPKNQNNPQTHPLGLYAEQISGSAFTQPRFQNFKSWMYRIIPSAKHSVYEKVHLKNFLTPPFQKSFCSPTQYRWNPLQIKETPHDFLEGIQTMAASGHPSEQSGASVHLFTANTSMKNFFVNSDGHLLIVLQQGVLELHTEFGILSLEPQEIAVIPKGIKFQVQTQTHIRGYICENFGASFTLPDLGPIGANGLANPLHFLAPDAHYYNEAGTFDLIHKFAGGFFKTTYQHHPLNVVGWSGNYFPYKYDLRLFNVLNSVSFDHPDPSIFTVLTSPSGRPGLANVDFVIFPPRWVVAEHTFRPPYYHRNIMSEFMGLICGSYNAKESFLPGGSSLHNSFAPHGPDAQAFEKARQADLKPEKYKNTLAFMFESCQCFHVTEYAHQGPLREKNYHQCWTELKQYFNK